MYTNYILLLLALSTLLFTNCKPVKEYQKTYLNDYYMTPNAQTSEKLESDGILFREGSSGGDGGKTGGGCGCN